MAEEHRCQAPRLCVNNCGFFGSPAMQDLCSKCYRDLQLKEQQSSNAKLVLNQTLNSASSSTETSVSSVSIRAVDLNIHQPSPAAAVMEEEKKEETKNRCDTCRKRVGLTGFKCRCGMVFCGTHRYAEQHGCGFDFKAMGKEQISKANPIIKAQKLDKI